MDIYDMYSIIKGQLPDSRLISVRFIGHLSFYFLYVKDILLYNQRLFHICLTKSVNHLLADLKLTLSVCLNNYICCCLIFRTTFFQQISDK